MAFSPLNDVRYHGIPDLLRDRLRSLGDCELVSRNGVVGCGKVLEEEANCLSLAWCWRPTWPRSDIRDEADQGLARLFKRHQVRRVFKPDPALVGRADGIEPISGRLRRRRVVM